MAKLKTLKPNVPRFQTESFGPGQPTLPIQRLIGFWLTVKEAEDICRQFKKSLVPNRQVLWSGMLREYVQKWADRNKLQTLTTALGPLLKPCRPEFPNYRKPSTGWSGYMHGASVIFAWFISQGDLVTVLSQPPPQRFHPSGLTYYQKVEEPVIKGEFGNKSVGKIVVIHPTVGGKAEKFPYEMWPNDRLSLWTTRFVAPQHVTHWRVVKEDKSLRYIQVLKTQTEPNVAPDAKITLPNSERNQPKTSTKRKRKKKEKTGKGSTGNGIVAEHRTSTSGTVKGQVPALSPATNGKKKAKKKNKGAVLKSSKVQDSKKNETTDSRGRKSGRVKKVGKKRTASLQTSALKGVQH